MKLRARHNSIRLRLTQREVTQLAETGRVEETIEFGEKPQENLIYAIEITDDEKDVSAVFAGCRITVRVPAAVAGAWTDSDDVGIEAEQAAGGGRILRILIEKDFACLKPRRGEDEGDAFPNPAAGEAC